MNRFCDIVVLLVLTLAAVRGVQAAPAWGSNCLSCHDQWQPDALVVFGEDLIADPDESGSGAPDRGPLSTFQVQIAHSAELSAELLGFEAEDLYAVTLKRLSFPGVEQGGHLISSGDCAWAEWGEDANYYSEPAVSHHWGPGPTTFTFDLTVQPGAGYDYYDLVLAVAGKISDSGLLFYAEEHFYLQVVAISGDLNDDGLVDSSDLAILLGGWGPCADCGNCPADIDDSCSVDSADLAQLLGAWG